MKTDELINSNSYVEINKLIESGLKVDHIITDPPYNISRKNNFHTMNRKGIDFGKWDKDFDMYSWIQMYEPLLNKGGSFIVFVGYNGLSYVMDAMQASGLVVKDVLKWIKNNPMPRNTERRYVQDTEFAIYAVKKGAKWTFNKPEDVSYLRPEFHAPISSGKERTSHPTQKSLKLMKDIIKIHTNENDLILDPFMGSGTTCVAAKELNRHFVGIELDNNYFKIAQERINTVKNIQEAV